MATWVFQGNPEKFDVDDYVARYPELIYWLTPRHVRDIAVGDTVFIWRSGAQAGAIAMGVVVEAPTPGTSLKHPEALGSDLWRAEEPDPEEMRTGIHLHEVRITEGEGLVSRAAAKASRALGKATLVTMPNGTVFPLDAQQGLELQELWGAARYDEPLYGGSSALEGQQSYRAHRRRERSATLREWKLEEVRRTTGTCRCELCGIGNGSEYPESLLKSVFEVHHRLPLAKSAAPVRTTLADLAVVCANCHRAVHASRDVEVNFAVLSKHFKSAS